MLLMSIRLTATIRSSTLRSSHRSAGELMMIFPGNGNYAIFSVVRLVVCQSPLFTYCRTIILSGRRYDETEAFIFISTDYHVIRIYSMVVHGLGIIGYFATQYHCYMATMSGFLHQLYNAVMRSLHLQLE